MLFLAVRSASKVYCRVSCTGRNYENQIMSNEHMSVRCSGDCVLGNRLIKVIFTRSELHPVTSLDLFSMRVRLTQNPRYYAMIHVLCSMTCPWPASSSMADADVVSRVEVVVMTTAARGRTNATRRVCT